MFRDFRDPLASHLKEIAGIMRQHKHEFDDESGIYLPGMKATIGGFFVTDVNGKDRRIDPNLWTTEGRNHSLDVVVGATSKLTTWYLAPFGGNVTVVDTWTAANFTSNSTEFTNYDEASRVEWQDAAAASGSIDNTANRAAFTISTGGGTIRGFGFLSANAKSATTGVLLAAARLASDRILVATDVLNVGYTLTLTSS